MHACIGTHLEFQDQNDKPKWLKSLFIRVQQHIQKCNLTLKLNFW